MRFQVRVLLVVAAFALFAAGFSYAEEKAASLDENGHILVKRDPKKDEAAAVAQNKDDDSVDQYAQDNGIEENTDAEADENAEDGVEVYEDEDGNIYEDPYAYPKKPVKKTKKTKKVKKVKKASKKKSKKVVRKAKKVKKVSKKKVRKIKFTKKVSLKIKVKKSKKKSKKPRRKVVRKVKKVRKVRKVSKKKARKPRRKVVRKVKKVKKVRKVSKKKNKKSKSRGTLYMYNFSSKSGSAPKITVYKGKLPKKLLKEFKLPYYGGFYPYYNPYFFNPYVPWF